MKKGQLKFLWYFITGGGGGGYFLLCTCGIYPEKTKIYIEGNKIHISGQLTIHFNVSCAGMLLKAQSSLCKLTFVYSVQQFLQYKR